MGFSGTMPELPAITHRQAGLGEDAAAGVPVIFASSSGWDGRVRIRFTFLEFTFSADFEI
jgi:hypothetical protein